MMRFCFSLLVLLAVLCGCASKPPPAYQAPAVVTSLTHFTGPPLAGPTTNVADISDPSATLLISVRLIALEKQPPDLLSPMGPQARLIAASHGSEPVLPTNRLTQGCRFGTGDDAAAVESKLAAGGLGRSAEISSNQIALPPEVTALLRTVNSDSRGLQLALYHPKNSSDLQIALGIEDQTTELAVLKKLPTTQPTPIAMVIPFELAAGKNKAVLALIHVAPPGTDSPELNEALAKTKEDLSTSAATAATQPAVAPFGISVWPGYEAALLDLSNATSRRRSMAWLCTQTNATICEDATLVSTDEILGLLAARVQKLTAESNLPHNAAALGWVMNLATLQELTQLQSTNRLPHELLAVLLRHTGQAGREAGSLDDILQASKNQADFEARVTAENLVYLEDNSPAARVRAFDWLASRGQAPANFDPLGPPRQRHDALEKAYDALAGGKQ